MWPTMKQFLNMLLNKLRIKSLRKVHGVHTTSRGGGGGRSRGCGSGRSEHVRCCFGCGELGHIIRDYLTTSSFAKSNGR